VVARRQTDYSVIFRGREEGTGRMPELECILGCYEPGGVTGNRRDGPAGGRANPQESGDSGRAGLARPENK